MKPSPVASIPRVLALRGRRLLFSLIILLLVSQACALPNLEGFKIGPASPTITPFQIEPQSLGTPDASPNAVQVSTQGAAQAPAGQGPAAQAPGAQEKPGANLPPALVEVEPLPHSEIGPGTTPVFYFNQPMQRASVEGAFKTQPDLTGRFEWLNDTAVRFVPGKPVSAGTALSLTIGSGAKAVNGMSLPAPVEVNYQAAGPLRLTQRLPAPDSADINPSSAVVVAFNRPVVAFGADPQSLPSAFSLDPAAVGRGEWLNTSTYIFYPQPALLGGARYTVHLNTSLASLDGSPLASDSSLEWSFSTSAPVLLSVKPGTEQPVPLDTAFTLVFNQPMETASVESNFSLLGPNGPVAGKFSWNSPATEMTFQPTDLLQRGVGYTLALFGAARSLGGAALGNDFAASLVSVPQFAITQTRPAAGETLNNFSGYGAVTLTFSSPAAVGQDFDALITLDPPVVGQSVYRDYNGYEMYVSGYFLPSTSYSLTVSPALSDRWGAKLDAPFSITFTSQPAQPALVIPALQAGSQSLFVPSNETSLPVSTTNLNRLVLSRGQLSLSEFIQAEQDWQGLQNWEPKVQSNWPLLLYPTPDVSEATNIPLAQNGAGVPSGLYFLKIDTQPELESKTFDRPVLLVVSPIQLVFKVSARQVFAWAVRVSENKPVPDAAITFYDNTATPMATCKTEANGFCQAELPARSDPYTLLYAGLGQPGDPDFSLAASNWQNGVAAWEFGIPYLNKGSKPEVYLYTDRPIYRPGQAVNFRAVVRAQENGRYSKAPFQQVTAEIASPYDAITGQSQMLAAIRLALDPFGAGDRNIHPARRCSAGYIYAASPGRQLPGDQL